ncbi:MAG: hypothetical protein Q7T16_06595 [Candidatus Burarchaeum sp.]|nr:hypothetical protein [Candidatus Burarchaeum sp.]MDO8340297.1 hypothetical protein [Candidatus Burarchaeum sp.]
MPVAVRQKKKTKSNSAGQELLSFSSIHSGLRVAEEIRNADHARAKKGELRRTISTIKPASEELRGPLTLFEIPGQDRKRRMRLPSNDVIVDVGPEVGMALGLLEETARYFAIKCFTLATSTTAVVDKQELAKIEGQMLTSRDTGRKFKHPHGGVAAQMWDLLNYGMELCRARGQVSRQEDYGKLCGASAAFACMCKAMKAYWLLKEAGIKPFLEYAAELRTRKAKKGPCSGKLKRSRSDKEIRKHAKYAEAYKIIVGMAGKNWRARQEAHNKMARIVDEAVREAVKGGRVLIYAKLSSARIGRVEAWELGLRQEIKKQIEAKMGEAGLRVAIAEGAKTLPEAGIILATEFFKFEKIDAAEPPVTLILQYDKIARGGNKDFEKYPARQLVLISKAR